MSIFYRVIGLIFIVSIIAGCSKDEIEEVEMAIEEANFYLTYNKCDKALEVLASVGNQPYNAMYLMTKSSAYACKASYSDITFFGSDISQIASAQNSILGSLTKFSTSEMTESNDAKFNNLQSALDTLWYSGGISRSSHANRAAVFPALDIADMNTQMLWMMLAQMGKYFFYYGNANPTDGKKGGGTPANGNNNGNSNSCLRQYTNAAAQAILGVNTEPCDSGEAGHPDLATVNATTISRMCKGVVLFNNFLDILINTTISSSSETGNVGGLGSTLSTFFDVVCGGVVPTQVCAVKTQSQCESLYASDINTLELYFAGVFETLYVGDPP